MQFLFYIGNSVGVSTPTESYERGIGGTETAVIEVSKELVKRSHSVTVVGDVTSGVYDGVNYVNSSKFFAEYDGRTYDYLIGVAYLHFIHRFTHINRKQTIFWVHNTEPFTEYGGNDIDVDTYLTTDHLDMVVCVSAWHKEQFSEQYPEIARITTYIENGVNFDPDNGFELLHYNPSVISSCCEGKRKNRFIYTSAPDRGLDNIIKIWPTIKEHKPLATLVIAFPSYSKETFDRYYKHAIDQLIDVEVKGVLSKDELTVEQRKAEYWLYPTTYDETFCITALEMMLNGVYPISGKSGNLNNIAKHTEGSWVDVDAEGLDELTQCAVSIDSSLPVVYNTMLHNRDIVLKNYTWESSVDEWERIFVKRKHANTLIDSIHIITLDTSEEFRRDAMSRLSHLGVDLNRIEIRFHDALNGALMDRDKILEQYELFPWKIKDHENDWYSRDMTPGEIGCAVSHHRVWMYCKSRKYTSALILEQDFLVVDQLTDENVSDLPVNWDMLYLGRNPLNSEWDQSIDSEHIIKPGASYNAHAYLLSDTGVQKLVDQSFHNKLMPLDEFLITTYALHPREDLHFIWNDSNVYSLQSDVIHQTSTPETSTTEHIHKTDMVCSDDDSVENEVSAPTITKSSEVGLVGVVGCSVPSGQVDQSTTNVPSIVEQFYRDRVEWFKQYTYVHHDPKHIDWDLHFDEPVDNVFAMKFFKDRFCDALIDEARYVNDWSDDRHEFYPTTDMVLDKLRVNDMYNDILKSHIMPACVHLWTLGGNDWFNMSSENFIAKYNENSQRHLDLHHDSSQITALVNLSCPSEYEGGGTWFDRQKKLHRPPRGTLSLHPGNITHRHGARSVTSGERFIVTSFMNCR